MGLSIGQILAVSYQAVVNDMRKPANQWVENALLREMEKQGMIDRRSLGSAIEMTLDYRRNPGTAILSTDLQPYSLSKTEVLTAASYDIAEASVPIVWSKKDEVQNPSENQKVALVKSLLENGINSHDDIVEETIQGTILNGLIGQQNLIPTSGQGVIGGIDASLETFWRNPSSTYTDDTDIEAGMTSVWNACAKGSGSTLAPTLINSDGATQAIFEGTQQANQRYVDEEELKAGFKVLAFKTSRYVFSQFGSTTLFFTNKKNFNLVVSKEFFRDRGDTQELPNAQGFRTTIYSALQLCTNNKSRLGALHL